MSFFNTTRLTGEALRQAVRAADKQDDAILAIYANARGPLSPSDVWAQCEQAGKRWPLTSVRRAITNLTAAGALERLDGQKAGIYGKPEHLWMVPAPPPSDGTQLPLWSVAA
jgi:Fe2+ or Zn2+ uptake regulation protein